MSRRNTRQSQVEPDAVAPNPIPLARDNPYASDLRQLDAGNAAADQLASARTALADLKSRRAAALAEFDAKIRDAERTKERVSNTIAAGSQARARLLSALPEPHASAVRAARQAHATAMECTGGLNRELMHARREHGAAIASPYCIVDMPIPDRRPEHHEAISRLEAAEAAIASIEARIEQAIADEQSTRDAIAETEESALASLRSPPDTSTVSAA